MAICNFVFDTASVNTISCHLFTIKLVTKKKIRSYTNEGCNIKLKYREQIKNFFKN